MNHSVYSLLFLLTFSIKYQQIAKASNLNIVKHFGAKPDGKTDSTKAFLAAWDSACASIKKATIYIPPGLYFIQRVQFYGQKCRKRFNHTNNNDQYVGIVIRIDGVLLAPTDYNNNNVTTSNWLQFQRVHRLSIVGSGTLDGKGSALWDCKAAHNSPISCPVGLTTMGFQECKDITINGLTSINSQFFHIVLNKCHNVKMKGLKIIAPANSPNTDGIHVQLSSKVSILHTKIATGDDCISIGPGSSDILIHNIVCGPGHGISIGSLGWEVKEPGVENVTVKTVILSGTQNGLRIKTWGRPSNGFVKNVIFQDVFMSNVQNPIIINQNYCPHNINCPGQNSGIKINNVLYKNIYGSSATKVGVRFECSKSEPCSKLKTENVNLTYDDEPAGDSCVNALGSGPTTSCLV
ncbi:polygalacturonase-like [Impatiens glandulifera]|uniref:polygalacturonase-like n=1 Tax=Impatiens glandulifera TaxID=253017 RepID=UPI001FB07794|nr:polygalacturonase-like [Impatiens glandulifera]